MLKGLEQSKVSNFSKAINRAVRSLTAVGFVALMLMMVIVVANIILRPLGKPIVGTYEAVQLLIVVMVGFALSYTAIMDAHVNMDMVICKCPKRVQNVLAIISSILSLGIWALIAWYSLMFANEQTAIGEHTSIMEWPIFPFRYIFALGAIILCLVMVLNIVKAIREPQK